uniref:Uncharacterized protein n=1 Tax=Setaria viridis TaxID=4556 RepID=A0A4U6TEU8_SETVI|nr:hypothetical protein SEVIR_8G026600v2 [Setaria viridis]
MADFTTLVEGIRCVSNDVNHVSEGLDLFAHNIREIFGELREELLLLKDKIVVPPVKTQLAATATAMATSSSPATATSSNLLAGTVSTVDTVEDSYIVVAASPPTSTASLPTIVAASSRVASLVPLTPAAPSVATPSPPRASYLIQATTSSPPAASTPTVLPAYSNHARKGHNPHPLKLRLAILPGVRTCVFPYRHHPWRARRLASLPTSAASGTPAGQHASATSGTSVG